MPNPKPIISGSMSTSASTVAPKAVVAFTVAVVFKKIFFKSKFKNHFLFKSMSKPVCNAKPKVLSYFTLLTTAPESAL